MLLLGHPITFGVGQSLHIPIYFHIGGSGFPSENNHGVFRNTSIIHLGASCSMMLYFVLFLLECFLDNVCLGKPFGKD